MLKKIVTRLQPHRSCEHSTLWWNEMTSRTLFTIYSHNIQTAAGNIHTACAWLRFLVYGSCRLSDPDTTLPISDLHHALAPVFKFIDSVAPGRFELISWSEIYKLIPVIGLRGMSQNLIGDESTLVRVMAWCRQATSHYLNKCWSISLSGIWRHWATMS